MTARVAGVVREIHQARGDRVGAGAPLATIESAELGEARGGYDVGARRRCGSAEATTSLAEARREQDFNPGSSGMPSNGWVELDQAIAEHAAALTERRCRRADGRAHEGAAGAGLRSRTEVLAAEADSPARL